MQVRTSRHNKAFMFSLIKCYIAPHGIAFGKLKEWPLMVMVPLMAPLDFIVLILKPTKQQEDKNLHAIYVHKCSKEIHKIDY